MKALLFMKKNSQRLPNKNIRGFHGKPLLCRIISTLLKVNQIEEICIDTDGQVIKDIVIEHFGDQRVTIFDRPKHLRGDHVGANQLISGLLDRVDGDLFLQTHVTNPLLMSSTIEQAIHKYKYLPTHYDTVIGATRHQSHFYDYQSQPINHDPLKIERTQDLPPVYEDNHTMYIFSRETFNNYGRTGLQPYLFEVNKLEAIDIDTHEDWLMAVGVYREMESVKDVMLQIISGR